MGPEFNIETCTSEHPVEAKQVFCEQKHRASAERSAAAAAFKLDSMVLGLRVYRGLGFRGVEGFRD